MSTFKHLNSWKNFKTFISLTRIFYLATSPPPMLKMKFTAAICNLVTAFLAVDATRNKRPEVVFFKIADSSSSLKYANLQVSVDTADLRHQITYLCNTVQLLKDNLQAEDNSISLQLIEHRIIRCAKLKERAVVLDTMRHQLPAGRVTKRAVFTILAMLIFTAAIGATSYGVYSAIANNNLSDKVSTLTAVSALNNEWTGKQEAYQSYLGRAVEHLARYVQADHKTAEEAELDDHAMDVAEDNLVNAENTMSAAINNRLHLSTLSLIDAATAEQEIVNFAEARGLTPLAKFRSDWIQQETSFKMNNNGFDIFIHVPLIPQDGELFIFQLVHLPMDLGDGLNLQLSTDATYLAINAKEDRFRAMTSDDLSRCKKRGTFFVCAYQNVLRIAPDVEQIKAATNLPKDDAICLWSLFRHLYTVARQSCRFTIATSARSVVQLTTSKFLVFTSEQQRAEIFCPNETSAAITFFPANEITAIDVEPGCTVTTDTHQFASADSAFRQDTDFYTKHNAWPKDEEVTAEPFVFSKYKQLVDEINPVITRHGADYDDFQRAINSRKMKDEKDTNSLLTWLSSTIGTITVLACIFLAVYMIICRAPTTPSPATTVVIPPGQSTSASAPPAYSATVEKAKHQMFPQAAMHP